MVAMKSLNDCCKAEAGRSLAKHKKVAVCDGCGALVLGYPDPVDYERTVEELTGRGVDFQVGKTGKTRVITYQR